MCAWKGRLRRRGEEEEERKCVVETAQAWSAAVEDEEGWKREEEEAVRRKDEEEEEEERPSCAETREENVGESMTGDAGECGRSVSLLCRCDFQLGYCLHCVICIGMWILCFEEEFRLLKKSK